MRKKALFYKDLLKLELAKDEDEETQPAQVHTYVFLSFSLIV